MITKKADTRRTALISISALKNTLTTPLNGENLTHARGATSPGQPWTAAQYPLGHVSTAQPQARNLNFDNPPHSLLPKRVQSIPLSSSSTVYIWQPLAGNLAFLERGLKFFETHFVFFDYFQYSNSKIASQHITCLTEMVNLSSMTKTSTQFLHLIGSTKLPLYA